MQKVTHQQATERNERNCFTKLYHTLYWKYYLKSLLLIRFDYFLFLYHRRWDDRGGRKKKPTTECCMFGFAFWLFRVYLCYRHIHTTRKNTEQNKQFNQLDKAFRECMVFRVLNTTVARSFGYDVKEMDEEQKKKKFYIADCGVLVCIESVVHSKPAVHTLVSKTVCVWGIKWMCVRVREGTKDRSEEWKAEVLSGV